MSEKQEKQVGKGVKLFALATLVGVLLLCVWAVMTERENVRMESEVSERAATSVTGDLIRSAQARAGNTPPPALPAPISRGKPLMALTMTQVIAEKHLRSPSTADWASMSQSQIQPHPDGGWLVNTYVDSQNGFGAEIRSDVTAVVKRSADGEKWRASYLEIGGQVVISGE